MTAESATLRGPYSARYVPVPYAGYGTFFEDGQGRWWSPMLGNDSQAPIQEQPGILRVDFDVDGHIHPVVDAERWMPRNPARHTRPTDAPFDLAPRPSNPKNSNP